MPSRHHRSIERFLLTEKRSIARKRKRKSHVARYKGGNMKALKDLHRKQAPNTPFREWLRAADLHGRELCPKARKIRNAR